ncbi:hypothetical protein LTR28_003926 [Elasticomyces elasticus]|nr:hypothetical protein LTR28_003926 [Elasticomyces elasticus]
MPPIDRAAASRLLAVSTRPIVSRSRVSAVRWSTTGKEDLKSADPRPSPSSTEEPPAAKPGQAAMVRDEGPAEGRPRHQPDYSVAVDYRLSYVDTEHNAVEVVYSIYKPAKTATQSGDWHGHQWRMDWDVLQKGHRWENPLMGWQSSADFMQGTHLSFKTKDDAIQFAHKQGYEYFVQEPNERRFVPKAYANQFVYSAKKLKQVRTK